MSTETRVALDAAIREHLADEYGETGIVTGWIVQAQTYELDTSRNTGLRHSHIMTSDEAHR